MVSTDGVDMLEKARDGLRGFLNQSGGLLVMLLFAFGTAVIIYLIFKGIQERLND